MKKCKVERKYTVWKSDLSRLYTEMICLKHEWLQTPTNNKYALLLLFAVSVCWFCCYFFILFLFFPLLLFASYFWFACFFFSFSSPSKTEENKSILFVHMSILFFVLQINNTGPERVTRYEWEKCDRKRNSERHNETKTDFKFKHVRFECVLFVIVQQKKNEVKWKKKKKSRQNTTGQMDLRTHRFKRIADLTDYLPFKNEKSVNNTMRFCFHSFLFIYCTRCQTKAIRNILYFAMAMFARVILLLLLTLFFSFHTSILLDCMPPKMINKRATIISKIETLPTEFQSKICTFLNEILQLVEHAHFHHIWNCKSNGLIGPCSYHLTCIEHEIFAKIWWNIGKEKTVNSVDRIVEKRVFGNSLHSKNCG